MKTELRLDYIDRILTSIERQENTYEIVSFLYTHSEYGFSSDNDIQDFLEMERHKIFSDKHHPDHERIVREYNEQLTEELLLQNDM